jgi:predicted transcriptional regulator
MESFGRIVVTKNHGIVRYYENHGRYGAFERNVFAQLWNPTAREILTLIRAQPGISQSAIADRLTITAPTVRWYMQRFGEDGIIASQRDGRNTRYQLTDEAIRYVGEAVGESPAVALAS